MGSLIFNKNYITHQLYKHIKKICLSVNWTTRKYLYKIRNAFRTWIINFLCRKTQNKMTCIFNYLIDSGNYKRQIFGICSRDFVSFATRIFLLVLGHLFFAEDTSLIKWEKRPIVHFLRYGKHWQVFKLYC